MSGNSTQVSVGRLHIAIPAMDEMEWLPRTLASIEQQACCEDFSVYVCVNQPESWWNLPEKSAMCENNRQLLQWLMRYREQCGYPLVVMDRTSPGRGWQGKQEGVGWARKTLFDHILGASGTNDIVVSMDADTEFGSNYLASLTRTFTTHPQWIALTVPYYHRLTGEETADRAMLRYEIYMRHYALNMLAIDSPYAFTAIGSAIAVRADALRKIGGITPMKSGEDFYLVQKLRKMGNIGTWNEECVYPATRFSNRVPFGTGPAMLKGAGGDWDSYPIFSQQSFQKIADTYKVIDRLFTEDIDTEFVRFLQQQFKTKDLWGPLRKNNKTVEQFRRAFHEKADGLRILQFLRQEHLKENTSDNYTLTTKNSTMVGLPISSPTGSALLQCSANSLDNLSILKLSQLRDELFNQEMEVRKSLC